MVAYAVGIKTYRGVNIMKRGANNIGKGVATHSSRGQAIVNGPNTIGVGITGIKRNNTISPNNHLVVGVAIKAKTKGHVNYPRPNII